MKLPSLRIEYPSWTAAAIDWERQYKTDEERIRLAIDVSRLNVLNDTGGPFGAAIFSRDKGKLVAVGMNIVVASNNCVLHGEIVAIMMAQAQVGSYTLNLRDGPGHELATSCEPCAMCLGATLWSGVTRLICGARREDAQRLRFDEGPVFPQSYGYLKQRGIEIAHNILREEAIAVLDIYQNRAGVIYNRSERC